MWEKTTVDGRRKLKHNAIPTIFGFYLKKQDEKNEKYAKQLDLLQFTMYNLQI